MTDSPNLDPDLAARIRASVDRRIAEQVQAARARAGQKAATRAAFQHNRQHGLQHRNAARAARLGLITHHNSKETTMNSPITATVNETKVSLTLTGAPAVDGVFPDGAELEYSPERNVVVVTIRGCRVLKTGKASARTSAMIYARATAADGVEVQDYPQWIDDLVEAHQPRKLAQPRALPQGDVDAQLDSLTVAAGRLVEDYSNVVVRGYLKDHPGYTAHRLDLVTAMADQVRAAVAKEMAKDPWPSVESEAAAEHQEQVSEFARHSCGCLHCLHGR